MNKKIEELTDLELAVALEEQKSNLDQTVQVINTLKMELANRFKASKQKTDVEKAKEV